MSHTAADCCGMVWLSCLVNIVSVGVPDSVPLVRTSSIEVEHQFGLTHSFGHRQLGIHNSAMTKAEHNMRLIVTNIIGTREPGAVGAAVGARSPQLLTVIVNLFCFCLFLHVNIGPYQEIVGQVPEFLVFGRGYFGSPGDVCPPPPNFKVVPAPLNPESRRLKPQPANERH